MNLTAFKADFSDPVPDDGAGPFPIVYPAQNSDGCANSTSFDTSLTGKIVLIDRGSCKFLDKAIHAAEAGAEAIIIENNDKQHPDALVRMVIEVERLSEAPDIPAYFVSYNEGQIIRAFLTNSSSVSGVLDESDAVERPLYQDSNL